MVTEAGRFSHLLLETGGAVDGIDTERHQFLKAHGRQLWRGGHILRQRAR